MGHFSGRANVSSRMSNVTEPEVNAPQIAENQLHSGICTFGDMMYGANYATSTIAIYNLIYFETHLGREMENFHPHLKFWSMKIPVTLAFTISLLKLVQPWTGLGNSEVDLLNAVVK